MTHQMLGACSNALFADLYEFTMIQAYLREGLTAPATFSLFARKLPARRNYLLACGLETVLDAIERLTFTPPDIAYLASLDLFSSEFLEWLVHFRFTGDIHALPEGTVVFGNEPLVEVVAPLPQAQLLETLIVNQIHLQTLLASKAARVVRAAAGRKVIDFGARRMQGFDAAIKGARAFFIAGVDATSNAAAGCRFGIPVSGTMAHSFVQAHEHERDALENFARAFPQSTMLVDTYDTIGAVATVIGLATQAKPPVRIAVIRIDSGDLLALSRQARAMLDAAGLAEIKIMASGGLDEYEVERLVASGAPIDGFGVGTAMGVSDDAPALDMAYKLTEYGGVGRTKLSAGKLILPGRKQVFRRNESGMFTEDVISLADETLPGQPLLEQVMTNGQRVHARHSHLLDARARAAASLAALPERLHAQSAAEPYPVRSSERLALHSAAVQDQARERARSVSDPEKGDCSLIAIDQHQ